MMKTAIFLLIGAMAAGLTGCATSSPDRQDVPDIRDTDPMIVQLSATARQAFEAGETGTAITLYRRALDRARAMDNSREIGRNAYNLAACLIVLEEWDDASRLLAEAEREMLRAGENPGAVTLLAAETVRRQGDLREALALIDRAETRPLSTVLKGQAYVLRAQIACDRGDAATAQGHLNRAGGLDSRDPDAGLSGKIAEVSGRIAELDGEWSAAGEAFDREAAAMQRAGRNSEMARALERAGANYFKANRVDAAADRFYRSARSWMAQGYYLDALRVIEQAAQLEPGDQADDETMLAIASLFEEIRSSLETQTRAANGNPAE
jgi:tetratricopeptide (TPR) repeat protein